MERQLKAGIAILMISYFGACAPVSFDTVAANKGDNVTTRCVGSTCYYDVVEEKTVGEGLVDILIVNDNSGSMSFEQKKMASAFTGFLTSIDKFDYRIAMITSDTSQSSNNPPSAYNGNGALQDGKLIEFSPGQKYLERATYNKDTLFNQTIKRPETLLCESSKFTQCPAGDERPIVTMGLTIKNYMSQFARPTAHLAVIVLSDEDERSVSKYNPCNYVSTSDKNNCEAVKSAFPFEAADEPQTVVDSFRSLFPSKTMSVHSIIVKPGDTACRTAQTGQVAASPPVLGFEGYAMAKLSGMTGGVVGDICASDYTNQLKTIGDALAAKVPSLPFRCRPQDDKYTVTFTNTSTGVVTTAPASSYTADYITTMTLTVNVALDPLTKVKLAYTCVK